MKIILPKPPSINHIYGFTSQGKYARSYITKEGKAWFEEAAWKIKTQWKKKTPIETPCEIWVQLYTHYINMQDADNVLKPILDSLQKNGVIKNDSLFYKIDIEKFKCSKEDEHVELEIMGY